MDQRRIPKLFPESADAGAVPRSADGKSLSEISGKRAGVLYGADFERLTKDSQKARQLVLDFYGPIFLLYSIYDGAEEKESVVDILDRHVDSFSQIFQQKATAAK